MAYIYQIRRIATEQCYVGHTVKQVELRWAAHLVLLSAGKHHSRYLQCAWDKYGMAHFNFELIEQCDDADKLLREQYYIDNLDSCFNTAKVAGSRLGVLFTEEQKLRLSAQRMGHSTTDEAKRKIGEAHKGKQWKLGYKLTDEQRARCSAGQTGLSRPYAAANAAIARLSSPANKPGWPALHRVGVKDSAEAIEKRRPLIIAGIAANPTIWITDNESTVKLPEDQPIPYGWYRGRTFTEEHKAAVLAAAGPRSDEAKAKMRASRLAVIADPVKNQKILDGQRPFSWWTNGTDSMRVDDGQTPPDGWVRGRTPGPGWAKAGRKPGPTAPRNPLLDPTTIAARLTAGAKPVALARELGVSLPSIHRVGNRGGWFAKASRPTPADSDTCATEQEISDVGHLQPALL